MSWTSKDKSTTSTSLEETDTWAQTLLTITPEDDAVLREIKPSVSVSANATDLLDLHTDSFAYRRPLTPKYLVDPYELEDENIRHMETQTYLRGVPVVDIPVRYKDVFSQTLYMSTPCPPVKYYKDVMTSMRDGPVPEMRNSRHTQTVLTFDPDVTQPVVTEQLMIDITNELELTDMCFLWNEEDYLRAETNSVIMDVLQYIEVRAFWIIDPTSLSYPSTNDNYNQTLIRYNQLSDSIVVDSETQTGLTCEPKRSNTGLLVNYQANKSLVKEILEEWFDQTIESRIAVDEIINEIIEKCAERVRYPAKDQDIQTLTSYKVHENAEDVLRKLRLPVVVDPLEASIVVLPLIDDLLKSAVEIVSKDAHRVTRDVIKAAITRSMYIGSKIDQIRNRSYGKPIDQILDERRKKIANLMEKTKTQTVFTQTSIAGVDEVTKLEPSKESYTCFCLKGSQCFMCLSTKTDRSPEQEMKMLRTQDILLSYKPCGVVKSHVKIETNRISSKCIAKKSIRPRIQTSDDSSSDSNETIDVVLKPKDGVKLSESLNEWSRALDAALTIPWSPQSKRSISCIVTVS
ncbi:hypothetical protein KPH14_012535 [Odynerus spinipes]|uniref:Uncharacterized protein n=1 Tax=Odynerus spinipes TaxID=1348599 RepID=A0AAD9VMQ8_9HYME|nr:hypothetical protein KPH14_012535 [Odynerus spinipes]